MSAAPKYLPQNSHGLGSGLRPAPWRAMNCATWVAVMRLSQCGHRKDDDCCFSRIVFSIIKLDPLDYALNQLVYRQSCTKQERDSSPVTQLFGGFAPFHRATIPWH
jgi:hypothetical protein